MAKRSETWVENWQDQVVSRLTAFGCSTMAQYLALFPGWPYVRLAEQLGEDIAAIQLEQMHFDEDTTLEGLKRFAMDSIARDLNAYLPNGWRNGAKGDFDTSRVFAVWATRLEQRLPEIKSKVNAVWDALEAIKPAPGWMPIGAHDKVIEKVFTAAW